MLSNNSSRIIHRRARVIEGRQRLIERDNIGRQLRYNAFQDSSVDIWIIGRCLDYVVGDHITESESISTRPLAVLILIAT